MTLLYQCPRCGASNEVKLHKAFSCRKCNEVAPDDVANEIRFAMKRRMPRTMVVIAGVLVSLLVMSVPNFAIYGVGALLGMMSTSDLLLFVVLNLGCIVCLYAIWRERRWACWPTLFVVGSTALSCLLATLEFRPIRGTIDFGMPLVLGPVALLLSALFAYLVWFFFSSTQAREYYAAVAISKPTPILKKRRYRFGADAGPSSKSPSA